MKFQWSRTSDEVKEISFQQVKYNMEKNNMSINGELPKNVNIRDKQGNVSIMSYRELKHHEESIIEDNIMFGIMNAIYKDSEIDKYEKQARAEWKDLKNKLRSIGNVFKNGKE